MGWEGGGGARQGGKKTGDEEEARKKGIRENGEPARIERRNVDGVVVWSRKGKWKCQRSSRNLHKLNEEEGGGVRLKMLTRWVKRA